ncbi:DUF4854 domain-containing protein [Eubacteriales bacterium OttesenSCG-928-M02]|nr:DUF4854 domain-containing protein [Eubacteriales bacterium OttesenSCG-928-M02]
MKKTVAFLLALSLLCCFALVGCSDAVKDDVKKVEDALKGAIEDIQKDADNLVEDMKLKGKATLEVLKEDEKNIKYKFTVLEENAEEDMETSLAALGQKTDALGEDMNKKLTELEEKGVKDAQIVVQYVDKEGKELYSKIFKK